MRRLLTLLLLTLTACSIAPILRKTAAKHAVAHSRAREVERNDSPDAAAEFEAMKRGITPGMDVAARYAAARTRVARMDVYATVTDRVSIRGSRRAATDTVSQRTVPYSWSFLGPGNIGGRTRVLVFDPKDPNVMYSGGVSGGIWKSTNGGASWTPIGDELVNLAVCSMAIDPKDGSTVYAGTGEGYFREDVRGTALPLRGDGIFVTHDSGATWTQLPATASNPDFQWVNHLVISPHDSHRLYAATRSGVWRSSDAGATWTNVLPTTVKGGALDLAVRTDTDGDYLFASCGIFVQATVYRNTNAEGNGAWTAVLSDPGMSRTSLAIAPSNPAVVYALAASNNPAPDGSTQNLQAVYRSDQNGDPGTWVAQVRVTDAKMLNAVLLSNPFAAMAPQCSGTDGISNRVPMGWHCNVIAVDPANASRVWAGGVDLFRSDDGGKNWGLASYWWIGGDQAAYVHSDQHVIAFHPGYDGSSNQTMFVTNDGGIFRTDDANDAVASGPSAACAAMSSIRWTSLVHDYGVTQFYSGAVAPDGRRFAGGAQDTGTSVGDVVTGANRWLRVWGGDGGYVAFDPLDQAKLLLELQYGAITSLDLNTGDASDVGIQNGGDGAHYLFVTPFALDPSQHQRLWVGGDRMWRCDTTASSCAAASPNLQTMVSAFAIAPSNSNHIVAGTKDGAILTTDQATTSSGQTAWAAHNPRSGYVSSIAFDAVDPQTVYASYAGFGGGAHVWRSRDGGSTWSPIDGSGDAALPDLPVHSVAPDPTRPGRIYLGTDLGIFVSLDGGDHWMVEESGLPQVITELVTIARGVYGPAVYAFTHGRGVWRAELTTFPRRRAAGR